MLGMIAFFVEYVRARHRKKIRLFGKCQGSHTIWKTGKSPEFQNIFQDLKIVLNFNHKSGILSESLEKGG